MIRFFFKFALRNIQKHKSSTAINLLGLTVGLVSCILISAYIRHELSFNKNFINYKDIYLSAVDYEVGDGIETGTNIPYFIAEELLSDYPEIKQAVRIRRAYLLLSNGDMSMFENTGYYIDPSFFDVFTVNILQGTHEALNEPNSIVLTKSYAEKYFGSENPMGKSLVVDERFSVKVTAVIDDWPPNTDFGYDFYISMSTEFANNPDWNLTDWTGPWYRTFFLLDPNCDLNSLSEKIAEILNDSDPNRDVMFRLEPLSDHHLNSANDKLILILIIFGVVAVFILIIACINFINLSIANASNRIKEISIRRIVGSSKRLLIWQQLGESVLLTFISFDIAYLLSERFLGQFNAILQTQIPSSIILNIPFALCMLITALLLGLLSGLLPALKISKIHPLDEISGIATKISNTNWAKKGLVVFQFVVSIVLIVSTIAISQQFYYIKNRDLGIDSDFMISCYVHKVDNTSNPKLKPYRDYLLNQAGVRNIALSMTLPFTSSDNNVIRRESADLEDEILTNINYVDLSFVETFGIKLVSKKDFSINTSREIGYCYINETTVRKLGLENPIGEIVISNGEKYEVVGVCVDYHTNNLQRFIEPHTLILMSYNDIDSYDNYYWMTIKCEANSVDDIMNLADAKLKEFLPENPYGFFGFGDTEFRAEALNKLRGIAKVFRFFTLIAIIIASMGILGLIALTVKNKTKEIGVRKVLGSTIAEIYRLISKEYIILAMIANIIASVPAWYVVRRILQDFAYRIEIKVWIFLLAFVISLMITLVTIAFHTIRAATINPVEALRYE